MRRPSSKWARRYARRWAALWLDQARRQHERDEKNRIKRSNAT